MDNKKINWWWMGGSSYDSDFQTVMNRWAALGYTAPSATVITSLNQLILDLKSYGIWTGLDGFWVMMLNNASIVSTTGAINYKSPSSNQFTFPTTPTFTTSGIEGNGVDQYVLTNFNTSNGVQYTQNSASIGTYVYKARTIATSYLIGHVTSANDIMSAAAGSSIQRINGTGPSTALNTLDYMAIDRPDASNVTVYRGTTANSGAAASSARVNENLTLLRSAFGFGDNGLSMLSIGRSFNATEHGNLRTAFLAHKTRLGL